MGGGGGGGYVPPLPPLAAPLISNISNCVFRGTYLPECVRFELRDLVLAYNYTGLLY